MRMGHLTFLVPVLYVIFMTAVFSIFIAVGHKFFSAVTTGQQVNALRFIRFGWLFHNSFMHLSQQNFFFFLLVIACINNLRIDFLHQNVLSIVLTKLPSSYVVLATESRNSSASFMKFSSACENAHFNLSIENTTNIFIVLFYLCK